MRRQSNHTSADPEANRSGTGAKTWRQRGLAVAVAAVVLCGLYGIADALNVWVAIGVGALALLALWRSSWRRATVVVLRLAGATLLAFLLMAGVAILLNLLLDLIDVELPILLGLAIALVAFGLVAYWYLRRAEWDDKFSGPAAIALAVVVVLGVPYLYGRLNAEETVTRVEDEKPVDSQLDVLIVTDGSSHRAALKPPPSPALGEFDVTYSVGHAAGKRVRWTLLDGTDPAAALDAIAEGGERPRQRGQPTARPDADHVLLLYVDGTPPVLAGDPARLPNVEGGDGEVERWREVARTVVLQARSRLPTFPLLQTTTRERLLRWKDFAVPNDPVSVQALGSQTAADAAVRLAIAAPTAHEDLALAMQHRPILLFDRREEAPRPLSITALFNEGRVRLCHEEGLAGTSCEEASSDPKRLRNGGTHLRLDLPDAEELHEAALEEHAAATEAIARPEVEGETAAARLLPEGLLPAGTVARREDERLAAQSAIYVHPVRVTREGRELLYLDYWWYLPYNPVELGGGALCGAGMVVAGLTCHTHESDWEGVTVVVDRTGRVPRPVAVHYAQHSSVVRYAWSLLREKWKANKGATSRIMEVGDARMRPLVFVAVGSHASYPLPCEEDCDQFPHPDRGEERHLGDLPWSGNDTGACGKQSCLQMLPTHEGGLLPALWNGYDGAWGEPHCFLTYYCDSGDPPKSPGQQRRYQHPTWFDGYAGTDWRFHDAPSAE